MTFPENFKRFLRKKLIDNLIIIKRGFARETQETNKMLRTYIRFTQGQASDEEMKNANKQFRSFLKTLGIGAVVILPFAPLTLPAIIALGKKLGVNVLPESFNQKVPTETEE